MRRILSEFSVISDNSLGSVSNFRKREPTQGEIPVLLIILRKDRGNILPGSGYQRGIELYRVVRVVYFMRNTGRETPMDANRALRSVCCSRFLFSVTSVAITMAAVTGPLLLIGTIRPSQ